VVWKFRRKGTEVQVLGLNVAGATMVDKFGVHDKEEADTNLMGIGPDYSRSISK
jgi:SulP family sulfate permease